MAAPKNRSGTFSLDTSHMSMQEIVEQGEIYILARCSSTSSDQAGLIPERVACLESLSAPAVTSKGIPINDRLMFFKSDKQAAWFEAGISRGGNYCCVSCTCHKSKFADITKVFNCKGRRFKNTQMMAIAGIHGKKPNCLNFSEGLNTEELRQMHHIHGPNHNTTLKCPIPHKVILFCGGKRK